MSIILANFGKYAISDCPFIDVFYSFFLVFPLCVAYKSGVHLQPMLGFLDNDKSILHLLNSLHVYCTRLTYCIK